MSSLPSPDAIALLEADHRKVEGLFEAFKTAPNLAKKTHIATQICLELTIHSQIEEKIFYPACRNHVKENGLNEALVEHDAAKLLIVEIEAGSAESDFYEAQIKVLSEQIAHHVHEEEQSATGLFAQARHAGLDMEALGEKLAAEKARLMDIYMSDGVPIPRTSTLLATQLGQASHG